MFNKIFMFFKSIILWIFTRGNWQTIRVFLQVADMASKITKSTKDDEAVKFIAKKFNDLTLALSVEDAKKVAEKITNIKTGALKPVKIGYDIKEGVAVENDIAKVTYNPKDGSAKLDFKINL